MARFKNIYTDHKGNKYTSVSRMCNAYGLNSNKMVALIKKGNTIEEAFAILLERSGYKEEAKTDA